MKLNHSIFLFLLLSISSVYAQKQNSIYTVAIFKWTKSGNEEIQKFILVDSVGNIFLNNKKTGKKVNLKSFTKSINEFIKDKKVVKDLGSDNPPRVATPPNNDEQNIYFTVKFLDDYYKEKNLGTMTNYSNRNEKLKLSDRDYIFYKYLDKKDLSVLRTLIE